MNVDPSVDLPGDDECFEQRHLDRWDGHNTPIAKGFSAIALDLLDRPAPIPLKNIADALLLRVHERGMVGTLDKKTSRLTTGDLIYQRDPAEIRWIENLIVDAAAKADNARKLINNVVSAHISNTAATIIAALLLTESTDQASELITNPSGAPQHRYRQISDQDLYALYEAHAGNISGISTATNIDPTLVRKRTLELGLPPSGSLTKPDITALALIESGEQFESAIVQSAANRGRVAQYLAHVARPNLNKLLRILAER